MTEQARERVELHGHKRLAFPGFNEETAYLERVNIRTVEEAAEVMQQDLGPDSYELHPKPIWMRYGPPETDEQRTELSYWGPDDSPAWWECEADHPDAVPFWKDDPNDPA